MTIENDNLDEASFYEFLKAAFSSAYMAIKPGASFYVWYANRNADAFIDTLKANGLDPREQLIWIKNSLVLGRQDYQWRHEPCLYGWKEGGPHYFIDVRSLTTVNEDSVKDLSAEEIKELYKKMLEVTTTLYEDKPPKSDMHPTMKPVPLFKKLVRNSSREGDLVLDLFGGSGTTLVACEEMNRKCCIMEYDPHYAEVIIQRWEDLTGEKAYLLK